VRWIARLVALTGVLDVVAVLLPLSRHRLRLVIGAVPVVGVQTAGAATLAVGLVLIYMSVGLRRRTREAWALTVALTAAAAALNLIRDLDIEAAVLSAVVCGVLLANRSSFVAVRGWSSRLRAVTAFVGFVATGFVVGLGLIAARTDRLVPGQPIRLWFIEVIDTQLGLDGPLRFTSPTVEGVVEITTGMISLLAVGTALVLLLRPMPHRPARTAEETEELRALIARGDDSLAYFGLRDDKAVVFSPSRKAAIGYRVVGGVCLAAGDPIGDPEAWPGAVREWLELTRRHGWTPAVLGCGERAGHVYARHGLDAIELGDEAIVDVAAFSLDGRPMRSVRQAVARVERAGYRLRIARQRDLTEDERAEVVAAADRMRDGNTERGFSMALSRVADPVDPECVLVLARDADGRLRGLLQLVPWGPDGLSLDLMRRDRNAENGLIEFLVVAALRAAPGLGVGRVSLNFAVLRSVFARGDRLGAGPVLRGWRQVLLVLSRFWQIESLYRANAKYAPTWEPRFLCFAALADLPRVGLAALRAEAFLTMPPSPRQLLRSLRQRSTVDSQLETESEADRWN
jgi:lysyl-tRNA synthetase class 2